MYRNQLSLHRPVIGIAAVLLTAATIAVSVVLPAQVTPPARPAVMVAPAAVPPVALLLDHRGGARPRGPVHPQAAVSR